MNLRSWRTKRRLKAEARERQQLLEMRVAEHADSPLREFVYLDEISVYSLVASRLGPVAEAFTESQDSFSHERLDAALKASLPTVASSEMSSALESGQSDASQVVRKSIVQTTFRELFELERDSLALSPATGAMPSVSSLADLQHLADDASQHWVIDPERLSRGDLIEVEVKLEAEGIFRMGAIMTAFFEILEENPGIVDAQSLGGLLQGVMANRMLDRLLVGLVPIRGRAVDYHHVMAGSRDFIVHKGILENLPDETVSNIQPLFVVGVAETNLFWRDTRRVLFSRSSYSMMCRLGRNGVHDSWTPVKLVEVLKEVEPNLGTQIQRAGEFLERRDNLSEVDDDQRRRLALRSALVLYAIDLATHHGHILDSGLTDVERVADEQSAQMDSLDERRAAFGSMTSAVEAQFSISVDPLLAAQMRTTALLDCGIGLGGEMLNQAASDASASNKPSSDLRLLDTEIVAIYW